MKFIKGDCLSSYHFTQLALTIEMVEVFPNLAPICEHSFRALLLHTLAQL